MNSELYLHVVTGPTAIGKTDKAIDLALKHQCPIVSFDSRQLFKELNIGVAKPSESQLNKVNHHFISNISIHEDYNAGRYAEEARLLINELFNQHENIVMCGGTGLYIKAFFNGFDPLPQKNETFRLELKSRLELEGIESLADYLKSLNLEIYNHTEIQNPQRLIRAIEIASSDNLIIRQLPNFTHQFHIKQYNMEMERDKLYERINQRVDSMIELGLQEEVEKLSEFKNLNSLQTVGYSEWWPYFEGHINKNNVIEKIKQHSRNYAKRQMTWFRNQTMIQVESSNFLSLDKQ